MNDNNNTKQELIIELRAYISIIRENKDVSQEMKLALQAILLILQKV